MNFILTLDDNALDRIDEIAAELQRMGNTVYRKLKLTGIITGTMGNSLALSDLEKIDGVKKVEKDQDVSVRNKK